MTACALALLGSASAADPLPQGAAGAAPAPAADVLARAYVQFGFAALRELREERPGANVFISPTSIALALAMTANGAQGATRDAMLDVLGAKDLTLDAFNGANQTLVAQLGATHAVQLEVADALWLRQDFPVSPAFRETLQTQYGAQAENLDFRSGSAPAAINAWAAQHTHGRITKIVDTLDPATVVVLTNAVAFKGMWSLPFDPQATAPHDFTVGNGGTKSVPMMRNTAKYDYANAGDVETIRLPYADGSYAMYVVLPKDRDAMRAFVRGLTPESFAALRESLQMGHGTIELPRFTIGYDAKLNGMLAKLGMGVAFGSDADFDGIHPGPPRLQISDVRHASFLKVDEAGTEAAAVTSVGVRAMLARAEPPPFHMVVDRPFFLAIRDETSGQVLFTGTIEDPS